MDLVNHLVIRLQTLVSEARTREEGQTLVEYSLILALVSIGSIAVLIALSGKINGVFQAITTAL